MIRSFLGFALLPVTLAALTGCAASTPVPARLAASPAAIIFGSCPHKPVYPEAAKQDKRQGNVVLAFHIGADSTVQESKVVRTSGHADLDEAARVGLSKCKFKPSMQNGIAAPGWVEFEYRWIP
jgi:TonB family protein